MMKVLKNIFFSEYNHLKIELKEKINSVAKKVFLLGTLSQVMTFFLGFSLFFLSCIQIGLDKDSFITLTGLSSENFNQLNLFLISSVVLGIISLIYLHKKLEFNLDTKADKTTESPKNETLEVAILLFDKYLQHIENNKKTKSDHNDELSNYELAQAINELNSKVQRLERNKRVHQREKSQGAAHH